MNAISIKVPADKDAILEDGVITLVNRKPKVGDKVKTKKRMEFKTSADWNCCTFGEGVECEIINVGNPYSDTYEIKFTATAKVHRDDITLLGNHSSGFSIVTVQVP